MRNLTLAAVLLTTSSVRTPDTRAASADSKIAGKPFHVAKAVFTPGAKTDSLGLYNWVSGAACDPQMAPDDDQLFIDITLPHGATKAVTGDHGVIVGYKGLESATKETFSLTLTDRTAKSVQGHLAIDAADGTKVDVAFTATVCRN